MVAVFNSWEALNRAVNNDNTIWGQRTTKGEEILIYKAPSGQLLLSDKPLDDPRYTEIEL